MKYTLKSSCLYSQHTLFTDWLHTELLPSTCRVRQESAIWKTVDTETWCVSYGHISFHTINRNDGVKLHGAFHWLEVSKAIYGSLGVRTLLFWDEQVFDAAVLLLCLRLEKEIISVLDGGLLLLHSFISHSFRGSSDPIAGTLSMARLKIMPGCRNPKLLLVLG